MLKSSQHLPRENRLLAALPRAEYERLCPELEPVHFKQGEVVYRAGDKASYAYFPNNGMISCQSSIQSGETLEVAMICDEGQVGLLSVLLNSHSSYQAVAQLPTNAERMKASVFRDEFYKGGKFQELILRYSETLFIQIAQSALCACFHSVERRLCRWLLAAHDCARVDAFDLTHECLSFMLGRSRSNVTAAARALQQENLIRYSRGRLVIIDRGGLEARSCECYRIIRKALDEFTKT